MEHIDAETKTEFGVRLEFHAHGDRTECITRAFNHFNRTFKSGWRLTYVMEELDTGYHEDPEKIPDNSNWDCEYNAVGHMLYGE